MTQTVDYTGKDAQCKEALEKFKTVASVPDWLNQHLELYNSVSIKPNGLPRITSSHFDGESYDNIQKFAHLYESVNSLY